MIGFDRSPCREIRFIDPLCMSSEEDVAFIVGPEYELPVMFTLFDGTLLTWFLLLILSMLMVLVHVLVLIAALVRCYLILLMLM